MCCLSYFVGTGPLAAVASGVLAHEFGISSETLYQYAPVPLPTLDKIGGDLQQLIAWIEAFKRRD
jgi:hypothetical protein